MSQLKSKSYRSPKVVLIKSINDIDEICSLINKKYEVIVNVSLVNKEMRCRIIYFLSGYIMACKGKRIKIEDNIYSFFIKE
ncbi:MAG: cell division protein SepF [Bacillales bacterium]|nr:cell division protein SepF [Bacillales bacterium]